MRGSQHVTLPLTAGRLIDLNLKRAAYERMGTPSYWVLDPDVPDLLVLELDDDGRYREVVRAGRRRGLHGTAAIRGVCRAERATRTAPPPLSRSRTGTVD